MPVLVVCSEMLIGAAGIVVVGRLVSMRKNYAETVVWSRIFFKLRFAL